jgi:excisionase family DNA binding protein
MVFLTTGEAATYLRLKERKLYELVAQNAIPCTKVTGRWLFPKEELDRWVADSLVRPDGMKLAEPMPIVGGSHDVLLEWALRESRSALATLPEGSDAGLNRFIAGELVAAAIHLHAIEEDEKIDANVEALKIRSNLHDAVLIAFARREQGIVVAPGNPLGIADIGDVVGKRLRMAVRPPGAGAQLLLQALLHRRKMSLNDLVRVNPPSPTGPDIAQAIRADRADCGIAVRQVAQSAGLDFIPITWEHFDLIVRQRHYFRPALQAFLTFLRSPALEQRARELGGYDVSAAGTVRFAP